MKPHKSDDHSHIFPDDTVFIRKLLIAIALIGFVFILWQLREVFLLLFGAVVIATILYAMTDPISHYTPLSRQKSLAASILIVILTFALTCWFAGSEISSEFSNLTTQLPEAWRQLREKISSYTLGEYLFRRIDKLQPDGGSVISRLSTVVASIANSITDMVLVLVGGLYFAVNPQLYQQGLLRLIPKTCRPRAEETLDDAGVFLRKWLMAKLSEMAIVGILTTAGLLIIGLPSAIVLGLIAGIAEFVPYIGLMVAIIPAVLIALTMEPEMLAWTLLVYAIVQQVEGNVIMPLIEEKIVYVPPVLTIFSMVVFGLLFGPLGLLFAAPLTVVLMVFVKKLYIEGALDEPAPAKKLKKETAFKH